ncbi:MAG: TrbI/VirB10 family protein [Pseudomonadota bacterium]
MSEPSSGTAPDIKAEMRLRSEPPRVVRLSRRVLIGLATIAGLGVGAMLIVALQTRENGAPAELYRTENPPVADELAQLPRDYTGLQRSVPQLGPPLPGDLGRAIVRAQRDGQPVAPPSLTGAGELDPAEQQRLAEMEAARTSRLFAQTQGAPSLALPTGPAGASNLSGLTGLQAQATPSATDERLSFLNAPVDRRTVSPDRISPPASPYVLQAGSVIPAALMTGIRSDLPGQVTAQVTENVYDTPTGRFLLIPQGARLIGEYDAEVGGGQSRILLVWTRLTLPGGRSVVLERLPGADRQGYAGLQDRVNNHWRRIFMAAGLATLLGVASEVGTDDESEIARAIRESGQDTVGRAGEEIVKRQLDIPPTLTIRPGHPVRVMVTRDLVFEPAT